MNYFIQYTAPHQRFVEISIQIDVEQQTQITLQLPAWRPGRYELQNYAKNIQALRVVNEQGVAVPVQKTHRERWQIDTLGQKSLTVSYRYYARQMDAGGCWLDDEQLYLNFICCLLYQPNQEHQPCTVNLSIPDDFSIACGIPTIDQCIRANSFYELADSPMIAARGLVHHSYEANGIPVHLWAKGGASLNWEQLKNDFQKFTLEQLQTMVSFPEKEYHFLFQFLPYKHYHGVEHRNSTVIVLGPEKQLAEPAYYKELLGISSHELFHAWNICKIRPAEMMPYDFTKENYFRTGFVAEGFTTYYGDLFLLRSGVFSVEQYFAELHTTFQRHFHNYGNANLSLAESSFDLWVDGYAVGIPDRKVSIYVKGAVSALILDLELRERSQGKHSLDDLLRRLWKDFGQTGRGYQLEDLRFMVDQLAGVSCKDFFEECIFGLGDLKARLSKALAYVGCELEVTPAQQYCERYFGFRLNKLEPNIYSIEQIVPNSPADEVLSKGDVLQFATDDLNSVFEHPLLTLHITCDYRPPQQVVIQRKEGKEYFHQFHIRQLATANEPEKSNFEAWTKQPWQVAQ